MLQMLNISQLARLSGKSRNTIKAMLADGRISSETAPDGKKGISIAEACRVFNLDAGLIERELAGEMVRPSQQSAPMHRIDSQSGSSRAGHDAEIATLKAEIEHLKAMNAMLSEMVCSLKADKEMLSQMVREQTTMLGQMTSRLLPVKSSAHRSPTQERERDAQGRFVRSDGMGKGVGSLLQGDLLE